MVKTLKVFIMSLVFLALCSVVGYFTKYMDFYDVSVPIVFAVIILSLTGIASLVGRKYTIINILTFLLNASALGFCIRAWYIYKGFDNSLLIMLLVSFIASLFILIFYAYSLIPVFDEHPKSCIFLFAFIALVIYVIIVFSTKTTFISTLGYYLIIELGFLFASISAVYNDKQLFEKISISTFSALIVAIIIAIAVFSDSLDIDVGGLDFSLPRTRGRNKRNSLKSTLNVIDSATDVAIEVEHLERMRKLSEENKYLKEELAKKTVNSEQSKDEY